MATAPSKTPSKETRQELATALHQVINQLGSDGVDFPATLIDASLARDGETRVIAYLTARAAQAAREASATCGQDPHELVRHFAGLIDPDQTPDAAPAWNRAVDAVLHVLGAPPPEAGDGSVEPLDVAAALLSLQVLGCIDRAAWKQNPGLMRKNLAARRATGSPWPGPARPH